MKRFCSVVICILFVLAIIPVFYASADEIQSWIIVDYRVSSDGTNWSSRYELQLVDNAYSQFPDQRYIKIDRIRVLDTTNKPSDLYISFSINIHPYIYGGVTSSYTYDGTQSHNWNSTQSFDGYFRSRSNEYFYPAPVDYLGVGKSVFCIGQYHLPDTTGSTAFTLTPDSDIYFGFTYSSSTATGVAISVSNINCVFVGNDSQLYDINSNLTNIKSFLNQWYMAWNTYFQDFESFLSWTYQTLFPFFQAWQADWLEYHDEITSFFNTFFYTQNYSYGNAAVGANMGFYNTTNPYLAINYNLRTLNRIFGYINRANWSYNSVSYDSDGIGTVQTISNVTWWDALLGYLDADNSIEAHHVELENEVLEQGLDDQYSAYLGALPYGIGLIGYGQNFFEYSDLYEKDGIDSSANSSYQNWYSAYNKFSIDSVQAKNEVIVDFYSQNHIDFGGGLN